MTGLEAVATRIRGSTTVAESLDAGFAAFEAIRVVVRGCEDRVPELFAAFMVAAGTAVEGRNALNDAPSLLPARTVPPSPPVMSEAPNVGQVADEVAALAALLAERLRTAGAEAAVPGDRVACHRAACAATEICRVMAQDFDETAAR
jgi:hypothetical protein